MPAQDGASPEEASAGEASPGELLNPGHSFPAYSVTKLVTATVVLRLAAEGRIGLDDPAHAYLRTVRLGDGAVTVRELLTHTAGMGSPGELFADEVPELVTLTGPLVEPTGPRGTFSYSNGGYGLLGQLIADVTGETYPEAAARLVLAPLGMSGASFPASWPSTGAVTGYRLAGDGWFEPGPGPGLHSPGGRRPLGDRGGPGALRSVLGVPAPRRAGPRSPPAARDPGRHRGADGTGLAAQ